METYSFKNDYSEGAHPQILQALVDHNLQQESGYGYDSFTTTAKELIQQKLQREADIHFVVGGTQANLLVISSFLRPHQSVIAADSGHIAVHETGAIEATGHKVNTVVTTDGKLTPALIQTVLDSHNDEHMVQPKMVYISNSTEVGSIYLRQELEDLYTFCQKNHLLLFIDGARLSSALTAKKNDVTLADIANLCDAFYIGGTKNGLLLGEAIVILNKDYATDFKYFIKQKGAMLAKGRVLGIQFTELFKADLFFDLGQHANTMAERLTNGLQAKGYSFLTDPSSNQLFPILPHAVIERLAHDFDFFVWQKIDEQYSAIRLVTSWATAEEKVNAFIEQLF